MIPCQYDNAYYFSDGMPYMKKGNKWGYVDKTGHEVTPFIYDKMVNIGDLEEKKFFGIY